MGLHSFRNALLTTVLECAYKNGLSSLGTPDEVIDDEVDAVLISQYSSWPMFAVSMQKFYDKFNIVSTTRTGAKAREKPAYLPGVKTT